MKTITPIRHPSGRPTSQIVKTGWVFPRVPNDGLLCPRLKNTANVNAIGFMAPFIGGDWSQFARQEKAL